MTTPLVGEPFPGDGQIPIMSALVDRLYQRLPEAYRTLDGLDRTWPFKRYLYAVLAQGGAIDATADSIDAVRPVGPAIPEPWALAADELAVWRAARQSRLSALGDPSQADAGWLAWLAQMVGAHLDPRASISEQRDTIRYATSGYRAGTRDAIADAAKSALTGSQYVAVMPHTKVTGSVIVAGSAWDITVVTRTSETPDPAEVLATIVRKGVKPAGAVLWAQAFEASWNAVEAAYPTWNSRDAKTWTEIEETGL
jgi:hypothetical protein